MSKNSQRFSRRGFLGATAALSAPLLIPRHVFGDEKNVPANEKITLGVIGVGMMMGGMHLPNFFKMPDLKVVAVCDVDSTRRHAAKKRVDEEYKNTDCGCYNDFREIMARKDVHAVACGTPDHWHAMVILEACKAGKDMYCEKPLTNNLMEAKRVMDTVGNSKIVFQTGSQQRADQGVSLCVRIGPQRADRPDQASDGGRRRPALALQTAGRRDGARLGLGPLAGTGADAAV